jgi:uncharacterized protein YkwD
MEVAVLTRRAVALIASLLLLPVLCAAQGQQDRQDEQTLFRRLNAVRAAAGIAELKWDPLLAQAAREHAERMAREGNISHRFPGELPMAKRLQQAGVHFSASAENVADAPSVEELHEGWMQSPPHHANMVSAKYNSVGIGVARKGEQLYAVQDFAAAAEQYPAAEAERKMVAAVNRRRAERRYAAVDAVFSDALTAGACAQKRADIVSAAQLPKLEGIHQVISFTATDPENLPANMEKVVLDLNLKRIFVGACYGVTEDNPGGVYWFAVEF